MRKVKLIPIAACLASAVFLTSCSLVFKNEQVEPPITDIQSVRVETVRLSADPTYNYSTTEEIQIYGIDGAGGGSSLDFSYDIEGVPEEVCIASDSSLSAKYPVYRYEYGFGQGGPLWEVDGDDISYMRERLRGYLNVLNPETEVADSQLPYAEDSFRVEYSFDLMTLRVRRDLISLDFDSDLPVNGESFLNEDRRIAALLQYGGFSSPTVVKMSEDNGNGDTDHIYQVIESGDDLIAADAPLSVRVISLYEYDGVISSAHLETRTMTHKVGEFDVVPYGAVISELKQLHP